MAIPESQLETWSKQGAITGSAATYATIKKALEADSANYTSRDFDIFLQGSYGNDTNIYAESDVDVVICYHGAFYKDLGGLSAEDRAAYDSAYGTSGTYSYDSFKAHVEAALRTAFGRSVKPGAKALKIDASGSRRNADVIVAFDFRCYYRFKSIHDCAYHEGISFFPSSGNRTDNFPKYHSSNATAKHQATNKNYKPLVRIFKNMRGKMVDQGILDKSDAPSYFIEGLIYNIPTDKFTGSYSQIVFNTLKWLADTPDRDKFVCVNERYFLLRDNEPVCWPKANGAKFINAAISLWNDWN